MKKKKLLKRLQAFFDLDERSKRAKKKELLMILKKLKQKQHKMAAKLETASGEQERQELVKELEIIYAQRKKGINLVKEL